MSFGKWRPLCLGLRRSASTCSINSLHIWFRLIMWDKCSSLVYYLDVKFIPSLSISSNRKKQARLGHVRPLGQPISVIQEQRWMPVFEKKWPKWPWRSKSMTFIFSTIWEHPKIHVWCKFGDSISNLWRVITQTGKFPRILSQNCQNDLEGQGQLPLFSIPSESIPRCMSGANLVILAQICDE